MNDTTKWRKLWNCWVFSALRHEKLGSLIGLCCLSVLVVLVLLLLLSGDIELNPGPKTDINHITPQLHHLMNILAEIAPQYSDIGTALNVPMDTLGLHPFPQYYNDNLRRTLQWWINNGPTVGSPVTYDIIINAIKGKIVKNFRVSEKLRKIYEQLLKENQPIPSDLGKHKSTHELPTPPPLKQSKLSSFNDDQPTTSSLGKHKSSRRQPVPRKSIILSCEPDITDEGPSGTSSYVDQSSHQLPSPDDTSNDNMIQSKVAIIERNILDLTNFSTLPVSDQPANNAKRTISGSKNESPKMPSRPSKKINTSSKVFDMFYDEIADILSKNETVSVDLVESLEANRLISETEKHLALQTTNSIIRSKIITGTISKVINKAYKPEHLLSRVSLIFEQQSPFLKELSAVMKDKGIPKNSTDEKLHFILALECRVELVEQKLVVPVLQKALSEDFSISDACNQSKLLPTYSCTDQLKSMYELLLHGSKILDTSQKFVELNLKIKGKFSCGPIADETHNKITFDELYTIRHGSFVLIQGAPGIGKSRLAYEICQTWKNKTDLQNYSLVILLQFCKKAVYTNWKSGNLDDLICNHSLHDDDEKNKFILELKEYKGEGVLIIFEGYDELPTEGWSDDELLECNQKNLFKLKSRFNKLSVFITTRSSSSDILTNCIEFSLQVEVLGFTDFGKDEFIDTFCEDSKEKELIKSKFPSGGQHVPLNMVILVSIFNNSKPEKLPKTLTELYDTLIRVLIQQHLKRHQQLQKPIFISNLSELPKIVLKDFEKLCKLAFNELEQNNSPVVESFDDIETLGLIDKKSQVNASQGGDTFVYDFLHQTIQEFLAAHHAHKAKLPINHIHESFKNRYLMIRIFLAGLTGLKDTCRLLPIDGKPINKLTIFHQLLESGNIDSVLKSGEKLTVARTWPPYIIPYDMFVLGQCISRSNCTWKLGFTLRSLTCEHIKMFAEGISTNKKILSSIAATAHNIFKIEYIKLPLNPIGNEGFIYLFTLPDIVLNNLNILYLNCIAADNKCLIDTVLKKVCQLKNLQQFFFHNNNIKEGPEQLSLIQELIKLPSLHHVSFSQLSSDECSLLLNGSSSIATIELYNISSSAIKSVISCLPNAKSLQHLQIHQSEVTPADIQDLPSLLPSSSIKSLHFNNCAITSDTARSILIAVAASPTVETLSLDDNILDDKCGEYITMNLESLTNKHLLASSTNKLPLKLKELSLVWNPFTEKSIKQLMDNRISIGSRISVCKLCLSLQWEEYFKRNYRSKDKEFFQFGK